MDLPGTVRVRLKLVIPTSGETSSVSTGTSSSSFARMAMAPLPQIGLKDFVLLRVVGRGTFAKVLMVRKVDTGRLYAMKCIKKDHLIKRNAVTHTFSEKNVLQRLRHPFIVNLKFAFQTIDKVVLVLDYISGGELFYHLSEAQVFSENRARFYAAEIASALGYLHSNNVIYRDLKPENILLDTDGHIVLTDFGLCKDGLGIGERTHTFCGSPEYIAPEMLLGKGYDKAVDWWALGTLIFEMLGGLPPFYSEDEDEMNDAILHEELTFPAFFSFYARSVLTQMLDRDPRARLGSGPSGYHELKTHPFFDNYIDFDLLEAKCVEPPMRPALSSETDVRFFDPEATDELPTMSVDDTQPLNREQQDYFAGFAFTAADVDLLPNKHAKAAVRRKYLSDRSSTTTGESNDEDKSGLMRRLSDARELLPPEFLSPRTSPRTNDSHLFDLEEQNLGDWDEQQYLLSYVIEEEEPDLGEVKDEHSDLGKASNSPSSEDEGYYSDPDRKAQHAVLMKRTLKQVVYKSRSQDTLLQVADFGRQEEEEALRNRASRALRTAPPRPVFGASETTYKYGSSA